MNKHIYRAPKVNDIDWDQLRGRLTGQPLVIAVDIAKERQYALLGNQEQTESVLLHWNLVEETATLISELKRFGVPITLVMESSGSYGDALRYQGRQAGFAGYQASAKRVHDAKEIFDGVPRLHDPKAACLIARMHKEGLTKPWAELDERERTMNALRREFELHQDQHQRCKNRLEATLSRPWPEVLRMGSLDSVTLEQVLKKYGSPAQIAAHAEAVAHEMRRTGGHFVALETIQAVIVSAGATLGEPGIEAERRHLMALAEELEHSRLPMKQAQQALAAGVETDGSLNEMVRTIGLLTTAILISLPLDPRHFAKARASQTALGLTLTEKSSGTFKGRLKLTNRGSAIARKYLYFAALRLINSDPVVAQWDAGKKASKANWKAVIAVVRQRAMALWHVARGEKFDANRLLTVKA